MKMVDLDTFSYEEFVWILIFMVNEVILFYLCSLPYTFAQLLFLHLKRLIDLKIKIKNKWQMTYGVFC